MTLKILTRGMAILALLAVACAGGPRYQANPQTSFDARSPDGLVVVGMKGTGPRRTTPLGLDAGYPAFSLTWVRTEKSADGT